MFIILILKNDYLHTPHLPPSFAQCLQYLQFLHALQFLAPMHLALASAPIEDANIIAENATAVASRIVRFIGYVVLEWKGRKGGG